MVRRRITAPATTSDLLRRPGRRALRALAGAAGLALTASLIIAGQTPAQAGIAQLSIFVDPVRGSDSATGLTPAKAVRTLPAAQKAVRKYQPFAIRDTVVYLRGGTYTLTSPLQLTDADSGRNGHTVAWRAYPGETPVITSARTITGWTAVGNGQYRATAGTQAFRQLYVNGVRATVARYPDAGTTFQLQTTDKTTQRLGVLASQVSNWANFTSVEMVLQLQWGENYLPLASSTVSGSIASLGFKQSVADVFFPRPYPVLLAGSPFHFENAREFISQPGEFYDDTAAGYVYYLPRPGEDLATATVTVPTLETLVSVQGSSLSAPAHDLALQGITFADTTWTLPYSGMLNAQGGNYNLSATASNQQYVARPPAAVYVANADRITITGNTFTRTGSTALDLHHGVHDSTVTGNIVTTSAGNGIMAGKFSDPTVEYHTIYNPPASPAGEDIRDVVKNITISNNLITHTGLDYYGTAAINAGFVNSTAIVHNEISDIPWSGISLGWGWQSAANAEGNNQVSYNHIANVLTVLCDAAGIYHLSNDPGTLMTRNYIHDVLRTPTACGSPVVPFYLDEGSNNMTVTQNVMANNSGGVWQNANGSSVTIGTNPSSGAEIIAGAGLESAYASLRAKVNVAAGKATRASSQSDASTSPGKAVDTTTATKWASSSTDTSPWWQVDLGSARLLSEIALTTQQDTDTAATRASFEVRGSNDPAFSGYAVLGRQDTRTITFGGTLNFPVHQRQPFRYLRVVKTDGAAFSIASFTAHAGDGVVQPVTTRTFDPATWYTIKNVNSGLALDMWGWSTADGGVTAQWTVTGAANQQWRIIRVSGDLYKIINRNSGKALDVPYYSRYRGTQLDQWTDNGGNNQLWYLDTSPAGNIVIRSLENQQVLDVAASSTTAGAVVAQWMPLGQPNQEWVIS